MFNTMFQIRPLDDKYAKPKFKTYPNKATLLLGRNRSYEHSTFVITHWLAAMKYIFTDGNGCLREHLDAPPVFCGIRVAHFCLVFCILFYFLLYLSSSGVHNVIDVSRLSSLQDPFDFL